MTINYPDFNDVQDASLRTWNRLNVIFNIKEIAGNVASTHYAKQFSKEDKVALLMMALYVTKHGYENTRREIMRKMELNGE